MLQFRELLEQGSDPQLPHRLGDLMNASYDSLAADYDCSCPELEDIVQLGRRSGSYGSRLTGAGFGGCSVHLVASDKVRAFLDALREGYYRARPGLDDAAIDLALFATAPESGACLVAL